MMQSMFNRRFHKMDIGTATREPLGMLSGSVISISFVAQAFWKTLPLYIWIPSIIVIKANAFLPTE